MEMYLAGVSVRRVEDITEVLWGTRVSPSTVVRPQQEDLRDDRDVAQSADRGRAPLRVPRRHGHEAQLGRRGAQRLITGAIAVNAEGYRGDIGPDGRGFLKHLKERGLTGVRLIISDACLGLAESLISSRGPIMGRRARFHADETRRQLLFRK